jgi:hypothetical protein
MNREMRAALVGEVQKIREAADTLLNLLLPEDGSDACPHPPSHVVDESSMGEPLWRCTMCGKEQDKPFSGVES